MRPFLCYLSLWHWVQVATALAITSISNSGTGREVGKLAKLQLQDAVGVVNASLVRAEQGGIAPLIFLLAFDIKSPLLLIPTKDLISGQYYIQLDDESGRRPATSSTFPVNIASKSASGTSHSTSHLSIVLNKATTPSLLPGEQPRKTDSHFPKSAKIAVAVLAPIMGITIIAVLAFYLYRKRKKRLMARNSSGTEERILPLGTPLQNAMSYPLALDSEDQERKMLSSAMRMRHATTPVQEDLDVKPQPSQSHPLGPFVPQRQDSEKWKTYKNPIEHPELIGMHELEHPPSELESPVVKRRPTELEGRMIHPDGIEQAESAESPTMRRARSTRDEVGSEHWTFLRESSATDLFD